MDQKGLEPLSQKAGSRVLYLTVHLLGTTGTGERGEEKIWITAGEKKSEK